MRPLAPLETAAKGVGALSFVPDADGVVRRVPMVMSLQGEPVPSLSAELLRVAQGTPNYILQRAGGGAPALEALRIGALTVPTTARGEMWLHYTPAQPQRYVPAWRVLNGTADPALLEGHIVVIGSSAPGLLDLRFNPLGAAIITAAATVDTGSATDGVPLHDEMLRLPEWFDVERYPQARFVATRIAAKPGGGHTVEGALSIKDRIVAVPPLDLAVDGEALRITGRFTIDRAEANLGMESDPEGEYVSRRIAVEVDIRATRP